MNKNESKYFNTVKKMNDALIVLLDQKDFEYITVKDICSVAKVNRSTFYLHYENTYDVLEEVIAGLTKSFNGHINLGENEQSIVNKSNLQELYLINDTYLLPYLEFIKENKLVYKAVKNKPELFHAGKTYERMFQNIFQPIMNRFGLEEKYHKYLMDFYMNGISSILLDWVNDDCKVSVRELSDFIQGIIAKYEDHK